MHLAVDYPAWGRFALGTGARRGRLVDVYLPRDLTLAKERGEVDCTTTVAHPVTISRRALARAPLQVPAFLFWMYLSF